MSKYKSAQGEFVTFDANSSAPLSDLLQTMQRRLKMPANVELIERNPLKKILLKAAIQELLITVDGHSLK